MLTSLVLQLSGHKSKLHKLKIWPNICTTDPVIDWQPDQGVGLDWLQPTNDPQGISGVVNGWKTGCTTWGVKLLLYVLRGPWIFQPNLLPVHSKTKARWCCRDFSLDHSGRLNNIIISRATVLEWLKSQSQSQMNYLILLVCFVVSLSDRAWGSLKS